MWGLRLSYEDMRPVIPPFHFRYAHLRSSKWEAPIIQLRCLPYLGLWSTSKLWLLMTYWHWVPGLNYHLLKKIMCHFNFLAYDHARNSFNQTAFTFYTLLSQVSWCVCVGCDSFASSISIAPLNIWIEIWLWDPHTLLTLWGRNDARWHGSGSDVKTWLKR